MVLRTSSEDKFAHDLSDLGAILWLAHADDRACGRVQAYRTAGTGQSPGECAGPAEGASFFPVYRDRRGSHLVAFRLVGTPSREPTRASCPGSVRPPPLEAPVVLGRTSCMPWTRCRIHLAF